MIRTDSKWSQKKLSKMNKVNQLRVWSYRLSDVFFREKLQMNIKVDNRENVNDSTETRTNRLKQETRAQTSDLINLNQDPNTLSFWLTVNSVTLNALRKPEPLTQISLPQKQLKVSWLCPIILTHLVTWLPGSNHRPLHTPVSSL